MSRRLWGMLGSMRRTAGSWLSLLWWSPLIAGIGLFIAGMEYRYPRIGGDYLFFMRLMVEGRWHLAHYGLRPMWYAVHLCGGMPMYGHPSDLFYSLPQFLSFVMDPWRALEVSIAMFLAIGYWGWMLFGRDVLALGRRWSHVLALALTFHGFVFVHVLAGHVNFFAFPLLGMLLWLLCAPSGTRLTETARILLFGLLCTMILYAAGFYVLIFFALLAAFGAPLLALCRPGIQLPSWRLLLRRVLLSGSVAVLMSLSKLVAVMSVMRAFPRTVAFSIIPPDRSVVLYMFRALFALPQSRGLFTGIPWDFHEKSMAISPVILVGAMLALLLLLFGQGQAAMRRRTALLLYGVFLFAVCAGLVSGHGIAASVLRLLPGFSSLRVMTRVLYIFSLLLGIGSVSVLCRYVRRQYPSRDRLISILALVVTLVSFPLAYYKGVSQVAVPVPYQHLQSLLARLEDRKFENIPVERLLPGDTDFLGTSGIICSEDPLFHWAGHPQKKWLTADSVRTVTGGRFNLTNPACYAYPAENACKPGDRILVTDRENFENFLSGGPLSWKVSSLQHWANSFSVLTLALTLLYALSAVVTPLFRGFHGLTVRRHTGIQRRSGSGKRS